MLHNIQQRLNISIQLVLLAVKYWQYSKLILIIKQYCNFTHQQSNQQPTSSIEITYQWQVRNTGTYISSVIRHRAGTAVVKNHSSEMHTILVTATQTSGRYLCSTGKQAVQYFSSAVKTSTRYRPANYISGRYRYQYRQASNTISQISGGINKQRKITTDRRDATSIVR